MSASQNSGPRALQGKLNIDEVRLAAKSRLPKFIFDYLDGGADGEYTAAENLRSFNAMSLIQRVLVDVDEVDTSTTILGMPTSVPFLLSSTGASRFFHIDGELAVARAAAWRYAPCGWRAPAAGSCVAAPPDDTATARRHAAAHNTHEAAVCPRSPSMPGPRLRL